MTWRKIPDQEYFSLPALGSSDLKLILRSVAHYYAAKVAPSENTDAQRLGTLVHRAVLEPERFKPAVAPKCDRRTKEGKAIWQAFVESSEGLDVVSQDELNQILCMRDVVLAHPEVSRFLEEGEAETTGEAVYSSTMLRCKPDWRCDKRRIILDLKTTEDASPAAFARSIASYKYHLQMAVYTWIATQIWCTTDMRYYWIAVEKSAPYTVAVYKPSPHMIAVGYQLLREAVERWETRSSEYDGAVLLTSEIELPKWAWEM